MAEDDVGLLHGYARVLTRAGFTVEKASDGLRAEELLHAGSFDVVFSDIEMPGRNGMDLLRIVREHDLDVPVILITSAPDVDTATQAIEHGALRYLIKPIQPETLEQVAEQALRLHEIAKLKRQALVHLGAGGMQVGDRVGLEASLDHALSSLWIAYQPIVSWSGQRVYAYEGLMRTSEPMLPDPGAVLGAAERLGRLNLLGRTIRRQIANQLRADEGPEMVFVNLHARDLLDEDLYSPDAPLSREAKRVVLEITERAALDAVTHLRSRTAALREIGFRIAIDDLGAGYAGLNSFAQLEPEVVKIDMSLIRDVNQVPIKRKLVHSLTTLAKDLGMLVVAEGVETAGERETLTGAGCDLLQGYLFARPARALPAVKW